MAATATKSDLSARAAVRAWVVDRIAGEPEVKVPTIRSEAIVHFSQRPGFMERLLNETLSAMVYDLARQELSATRGKNNVILLGDTVTTPEGIKSRAIKLQHKWNLFYEYAGDRHVLLMNMSRDDLERAAATRQARGDTEHAYAELWRRLLPVLEDGEVVSDRFKPEDIEAIYQSITTGKA